MREKMKGKLFWRYWRDALASLLLPPPSVTPASWLQPLPDLSGQRCCLFVSYVPGTRVPEHAIVHAQAWADAGYKVVMVLAADRPDQVAADPSLDFCTAILLRQNQGYDFGAWAAAMGMSTGLFAADILAITNDSVYGPLGNFSALLSRVEAEDADIVGLTDSREKVHHLQSYCLFFKRQALIHPALARFWRGVRGGGRDKVIHAYEMTFRARMVNAGLRVGVLFPATSDLPPSNPTLQNWRSLLASGFPFVKVQLLRDNPLNDDLTGWRNIMRDAGFDPTIVDRHLGDRLRSRG